MSRIIMVPWAHVSPYPQRYLHRFGRFCRAHGRVRQTDRQTTLLYIPCCDRPHLASAAMWPKKVIQYSLTLKLTDIANEFYTSVVACVSV